MREFCHPELSVSLETQTQIVASHFFSSRIVVVLPWPDGSKADGTSSIMNCTLSVARVKLVKSPGDERSVSLSGEAIC